MAFAIRDAHQCVVRCQSLGKMSNIHTLLSGSTGTEKVSSRLFGLAERSQNAFPIILGLGPLGVAVVNENRCSSKSDALFVFLPALAKLVLVPGKILFVVKRPGENEGIAGKWFLINDSLGRWNARQTRPKNRWFEDAVASSVCVWQCVFANRKRIASENYILCRKFCKLHLVRR